MASPQISIPSTSTASQPKPHTTYQISIHLPLRTYTISKRYSDFTTLHTQLTSSTNQAPPYALPPKHFFKDTLNNPLLTEERRRGLETYLIGINEDTDSKWRDTSVWRTFLNLPHIPSGRGGRANNVLKNTSKAKEGTSDPELWLDTLSETKNILQSARETISARTDTESLEDINPASWHDTSMEMQKLLARAGTLLSSLKTGLDDLAAEAKRDEWGSKTLGEGEIRRRRDLLSATRREKDSLDELLALSTRKVNADREVSVRSDAVRSNDSTQPKISKGRVLGRETARTKELDNSGLVQMQRDVMAEQDEDVRLLTEAVRRQRELGMKIHEELELQNEMLGGLDEDVDRVEGKIGVARKRVKKIS